MGKVSDSVRDAALNHIKDNTEKIHICSSEPTDFADVDVKTLGNKEAPAIGAVANGAVNGRRITIAEINDGTATASGTATHWALVSAGELLATDTLEESVEVIQGELFIIGAFDIEFPDQA